MNRKPRCLRRLSSFCFLSDNRRVNLIYSRSPIKSISHHFIIVFFIDDDFRPFLMSFGKSSNDYINAVIIPVSTLMLLLYS